MGQFLEDNLAGLTIHTFWPVNFISINYLRKYSEKTTNIRMFTIIHNSEK